MIRLRMPSRRDATFRVLFGALAAAVAFSLGGMILMRVSPAAVVTAGPLLPWLMRTPTWVYMLSLPALALVLYLGDFGWRRSLLMLIWGSMIGMIAELMGTGTGFPFGAYAYTDFLGPKILDRVPYLIPLSWYAVSIVSLDLAARLGLSRAQRIVTAAAYMVLWDFVLDPAMGAGFPIWTWQTEGFYYGMPALNWAGWFGTSLVIMWGYETLAAFRPPRPTGRATAVWLVNGAFPVGICAVTGLWGAVLVGTMALAVPVIAAGIRREPAGAPSAD